LCPLRLHPFLDALWDVSVETIRRTRIATRRGFKIPGKPFYVTHTV